MRILPVLIDKNNYENPLFLLVSSITGWVFLYSFSYFLKHIRGIKKLMICIGKRTISVLILHFLSLKIVEVVVIIYYDMPFFCLAAFPNLYGNKALWWLLYTIVGVGIPILTDILYHYFCAAVLPPPTFEMFSDHQVAKIVHKKMS